MKTEEEVLQKLKHVLSVGNDSQAIRIIEQYGLFKEEESKQFSLQSVMQELLCLGYNSSSWGITKGCRYELIKETESQYEIINDNKDKVLIDKQYFKKL